MKQYRRQALDRIFLDFFAIMRLSASLSQTFPFFCASCSAPEKQIVVGDQGDQTRRIFASWAIVFFASFFF
jgi:hypothetical protein